MMEKGDIVIIPAGRFVCVGVHPHGDSMALIEEDLYEVVDAATSDDFVKADECEFSYRNGIWIY